MLTKVIDQSKIDHFAKWLERADKIVIVAHVAPDGDAVGSSLGLWHFLNTQDKDATVIVPNAFPDFLKWMPGSKDILLYDRYKEFADKLIAEAMSSVASISTLSAVSMLWQTPCWLLLRGRYWWTII